MLKCEHCPVAGHCNFESTGFCLAADIDENIDFVLLTSMNLSLKPANISAVPDIYVMLQKSSLSSVM